MWSYKQQCRPWACELTAPYSSSCPASSKAYHLREVLAGSQDELDAVKSTVGIIRTVVGDTSNGMHEVSRNVEDIRLSTANSDRILPTIDERTASTTELMVQQADILSQVNQMTARIDRNTLSIQRKISHVDRRLENFEELLTDMARRTELQLTTADLESARLAARPSNLQAMCDGLRGFANTSEEMLKYEVGQEHYNFEGRMIRNTTRCSCKDYCRRNNHQIRWGPVKFKAKNQRVTRHSRDCPMEMFMDNENRSSLIFEVTIPMLQLITGKAVRLFWSLTSGRSGLHLHQRLNVNEVVDPDCSLPFRLGSFAESVLSSPESQNFLGPEGRFRLLGAIWRRLLWCYLQNKAFPTDVNERGETLLYYLLQRMKVWSTQNMIRPHRNSRADACFWMSMLIKPTKVHRDGRRMHRYQSTSSLAD